MTRIPAWPLAFTVEASLALQLPLEEALQGTQLSLQRLADPRSMVEWEDLVQLCRNLESRGVALETIAEIYTGAWDHPSFAQLARGFQRLPNPSTAYELLMRTHLATYFRVLRHRRERLDEDLLQLDLELVEGAAAHPMIWKAIEGLLRGLPHLLGLPPASITSVAHERSVRFVIQLPKLSSPLQRWRRRIAGWLGSRRILDQMVDQQEQLADTFERVRIAHEQVQQQADDLRESEAQYRSIIENTADLIVLTDARGRILMSSSSTRRLFEVDASSIRRRSIRALDHIHPSDMERVRQTLDTLLRTRTHPPIEFRVMGPRGRVIWIEASGRCIQAADGRDQLVIVGRDISARREAEREQQLDAERLELEVRRRTHQLLRANQELRDLQSRLIDAERIGATQELAGSVAHAINNPLAALTGNAELLREQYAGSDSRIDRVLHLAARIRSVVDRTLQLSREGTLDLSLESPSAILREVRDEIEALCLARQVRVALRTEPKLPNVYADRTLLRSALVAIAENAVDASPKGQTVRMQARALHGMRVVEFRFEDAGSGIPSSALDRMFEPFFTTKSGGTGLGLAIARGVISGHEGRIYFAPRPGGGTIATVEIPFYQANRALPARSRRLAASAEPPA